MVDLLDILDVLYFILESCLTLLTFVEEAETKLLVQRTKPKTNKISNY